MSKIDLHTHTQKCKSGDGTKRIISPENFIEIMHNNNVCICAITNHNKFDIKEYEKIKSIDNELVIFPGIELDVTSEGDQYHIVLVCKPSKNEEFYRVFDNDPNRDYDKFNLSKEKFLAKIKEFNQFEIIIIPHYWDKDKKRAISEDFRRIMQEELKDYVIILEPGKLRTMGIINNHNELALIGSDVKDWNNYASYPLPDMKVKVNTFEKFIELAKDTTLLNKMINDLPSDRIDIERNEILIHKDINIIFGEKGSGKTILLDRYIYPFYLKSGKKVVYHKGSEYQNKYKEILNEKISKTIIDKEKTEKITRLYENISSYKEGSIRNFKKTYIDHYNNEVSSKNKDLLKKSKYRQIRINDNGWIEMSNDFAMKYLRLLAEFTATHNSVDTVIGTSQDSSISEIFPQGDNTYNSHVISISLEKCLPIPSTDVGIEDLIYFKEHHRDDLYDLRSKIRNFEQSISECESNIQLREILETFRESWEHDLENAENMFRGKNIKFFLGNLKSFVIDAAAAAGLAQWEENNLLANIPRNAIEAVIGVAGLVGIGSYSLRYKKQLDAMRQKNGFAYVISARREGIL